MIMMVKIIIKAIMIKATMVRISMVMTITMIKAIYKDSDNG